MKNKNVIEDALTKCINETMNKDTLTQHDIDNLLKAASIQVNLSRNETDIYKADKEAEASKYAADKKATADLERSKADKEIAKLRAEAEIAKAEAERYSADVHAQTDTVRANAEIYSADKRAEAERYSADQRYKADIDRSSAEKYSADIRAEAEHYSANRRAEAEKEVANIKNDADMEAYRRQFWGNVITGGLKLAEGLVSIAAVIVLFNKGIDFEQTGVVSSHTFKQIMANGLKLIKK